MRAIRQYIKVRHTGYTDFPYNLQLWTVYQNGMHVYAGFGKFCKDVHAAHKRKKELLQSGIA